MTEPETETQSGTQHASLFKRKWLIPGAGLLLILLAAAIFLFVRSNGKTEARGLKPERATAVTTGFTPVSQEAQTPNFSQLNNNPSQFQNQRLQVTGAYTPLHPSPCADPSGPVIHYALIAEGLRMEAVGFERALRLLPDGFTVTVEGVWRHYQGPLGCGPHPRPGSVWYLDVERIVEPNPMPNFTAPTGDDLTLTPPPDGTAVFDVSPTPVIIDGTSLVPTPTVDPSASPTPTRPSPTPGTPLPTSQTLTPSPGPSPTLTPFITRTPRPTASNTPPPGSTPTSSATPPPGSSPTPTTDPFATATPDNITRTPPPPTPTPDGSYPGPMTPFPTPIPSPYP